MIDHEELVSLVAAVLIEAGRQIRAGREAVPPISDKALKNRVFFKDGEEHLSARQDALLRREKQMVKTRTETSVAIASQPGLRLNTIRHYEADGSSWREFRLVSAKRRSRSSRASKRLARATATAS